MRTYFLRRGFIRVFNNEGDAAAATAAAEAAAKAAADAAKSGNGTPKTFTQDDVNKLLSADRQKHKTQIETTLSQLEELKKAQGLTQEEKKTLETRIEELSTSLLTKEEQAKKEKEKIDNEYKSNLKKKEDEVGFWRNSYSHESTSNRITRAATTHKAYSVEQIADILMPKTRLTEELDDAGKPTGRWIPKVKMHAEKDGKPVELDLTIEDAVKLMKETPKKYGNLFESDTAGGAGGYAGNRYGGGGGDDNSPPSDPTAYREWRNKRKGRSK